MAKDMFEELGPMLSAIGEQAAADLGGDPSGIYIYAEAGEGWYSDYVFRLEGDVVRFHWASPELGELVWNMWKMGEPGKRWSVMEYQIVGDQFDVHFKYPEDVDVEEFDKDRRENAVKARFGDRPIIFPPWEATRGMKL